MTSLNLPLYYTESNKEISIIQPYENQNENLDWENIIKSIFSPDIKELTKRCMTEELNESSLNLSFDQEEELDYFQENNEISKSIESDLLEYSLNASLFQQNFNENFYRSKGNLLNDNELIIPLPEEKNGLNETLACIDIKKNEFDSSISFDKNSLSEKNIEQNDEKRIVSQKNLNNLIINKNIESSLNISGSSTNDSSINSIKNNSSFNIKKNIFVVSHIENNNPILNLDKRGNNSYCNRKRKRGIISTKNKIKREDLDKCIFRHFKKHIIKNIENKEIREIIINDSEFCKELLKHQKNRKKGKNNHRKYFSFEYNEQNFKSYNQRLMKFIFSRDSAKELYKIYLKSNNYPKTMMKKESKFKGFSDSLKSYWSDFSKKYSENDNKQNNDTVKSKK